MGAGPGPLAGRRRPGNIYVLPPPFPGTCHNASYAENAGTPENTPYIYIYIYITDCIKKRSNYAQINFLKYKKLTNM